MTVYGSETYTLMDSLKGRDPDGRLGDIVNVMGRAENVVMDMPWMATNDTTSHVTHVNTSLPEVFYGRAGRGIAASKSDVDSVRYGVASLETRMEVDHKTFLTWGEDSGRYMKQKMDEHAMALGQKLEYTIFNGSTAINPDSFNGLSKLYNDTSLENGANIIDGGGVSSVNTSMWIIDWHPTEMHGIYQKGFPAGLQILHEKDASGDGCISKPDANGYPVRMHSTLMSWSAGISITDWKRVCRIANIDVNLLNTNNASQAKLPELIVKGLARVTKKGGKKIIYANADIFTNLQLQAQRGSYAQLGYMTANNQFGTSFEELVWNGIPIRRADEILSSEGVVS